MREEIKRAIDSVGLESKIETAAKVIIVPHAGYCYSLTTAAYGYKALMKHNYERIILLGPSHRVALSGVGTLCPFDTVATPLGSITVDKDSTAFYSSTLAIGDQVTDTNEHSLEMHYPLIKYCFPNAKVIPIMIGHKEDGYLWLSELLSKELTKENTAMIVSSDFCHWGSSYGYTPKLNDLDEHTSKGIKKLDIEGLTSIFKGDTSDFSSYLKRTRNTICGQRPILVAMKAIQEAKLSGTWNLLHYSQSNEILAFDPQKSSVSYVAAAFM